MAEKLCEVPTDGNTCPAALISEYKEGSFNAAFAKSETKTTRFDAAEVAVGIEEAAELRQEGKGYRIFSDGSITLKNYEGEIWFL